MQVLVNRAHVRELQAPAKLNSEEAETHVPDLPEAQAWFVHADHLLLNIAAERFGSFTLNLSSFTDAVAPAPRRSVKDLPCRNAKRQTSNSISAGLPSLLIATTTASRFMTRAYAYCCSAT